jgi:hypothetical protein
MSEDSGILRDHINGLSGEELTAIVTVDRAQYREEAIAFAEAELRRRGPSAVREERADEAGEPAPFWGETPPPWVEPQTEGVDDETAESEDSEDSEEAGALDADEEASDSDEPAGVRGEGEFWREPRAPVAFRVFRSSFISWEELFQQAADFAAEVGPERVINISHSADKGDGVVTVWYRA